MKITASIVTYNNEKDILNLLSSIQKTNLSLDNVYVVDNASQDKTVENIRKNFNDIKLIEPNKNLGYGGGHNLAISAIDSDYHLIINPDILLDEDNLSKMIEYMERHPEVVVLTPKVLNVDGTEQFLPKKRPTYRFLICGRLPFKFAKRIRKDYTLENEKPVDPVEVDFCTGCFMVCRTSALKEVGGFDERYFMYFEDADLTRKLQYIGKTVYYPKASITHAWKRESSHSFKLFRIHLKSMRKYFKKWRSIHDKN